MAFPFGGHPRFDEYLEWVRREQGCTYTCGYAIPDGTVEPFVRIENPANGKHVIHFAKMSEHLTASVVAHLDRRLGIDSPFAKIVGYDED